MTEPEPPGYTRLTRDARTDHNLFRLPDGPWFPWSREFRWDLMPWNRKLRRDDQERQRRDELTHLLEAAAGTIGIVARRAGFDFNSATTGTSNGEVSHAVLYEASPRDVADRYPGLTDEDDRVCIDLWIYWYPERGHLEVNLPGFGGPHGIQVANRPDLEEATRRPVTNKRRLRPVLQSWSEALETWLQTTEAD